MRDKIKVLGQSIPAMTTLTDIYTVPSVVSAVISTIILANQGGSDATFRISIAVAGAVDTPKQYLFYDSILASYRSLSLTLGITLAATDIIRGYSSNGSISFNVFGTEVV